MKYLDIPFEIKAEDVQEDGTFRGYGSTFGGKPDSYSDVVVEGAFSKSLSGGRKVRMLWQHMMSEPIGKWISLVEDKRGLKVEGKLTLGVQRANEAYALLKDGAIDSMSIGFNVPEGGSEFDDKKRIRYLKQIDLWEISLVTFPANERAKINTVKAIKEAANVRDLEDALREAGLSKDAATLVACKMMPKKSGESQDLQRIFTELELLKMKSFIV